jgi:hypothetical protein
MLRTVSFRQVLRWSIAFCRAAAANVVGVRLRLVGKLYGRSASWGGRVDDRDIQPLRELINASESTHEALLHLRR